MQSTWRARGVRRFLPLALGLCVGAPGCSCSSSPVFIVKPLDPAHAKLLNIGIAYWRFCTEQKRAPKGPADLEPLLAQLGKTGDPWRSPRDGQPFVVCWGVDLNKRLSWAKSTPVLGYEKEGAGGSRYVLTAIRSVELLSDKEFHEGSFPPGYDPGS